MKGSVLDFLQLAEKNPGLARELVELAARYSFEFEPFELSDAEARAVTGGAFGAFGAVGVPTLSGGTPSSIPSQQLTSQTLSNVSRMLHNTSMSIIKNIG